MEIYFKTGVKLIVQGEPELEYSKGLLSSPLH